MSPIGYGRPPGRRPKTDGRVEGWYGRRAARHFADPVSVAFVDLLARRARAGDREALEELAGHLGGIAEALAAKHAGAAMVRGVERDDARQEAMAAMLAGLGTWRPEKSSFRSYAFSCARFAVLDLLNASYAAHVPRGLAYGSPGTPAKDAGRLRPYARAQLEAATSAASSLQSMRSADGPEGGGRYEGWVVSSEKGYEEALGSLALRQILGKAWYMLTARERQAVVARFGLGEGAEEKKLVEVAEEMGLSNERARQCVLSGLKKLRRVA
ncbi:sigma-70 family RNA polymerase sigma factor [Rubrobacter marinus]|uniref:Sigma-70 family RNA polymerase sigma factor n=1 Tax=Rubrobacter marinus TaxID=2653852 RepID=A0A6G8PZG2_9ACTN|nr:sigma-70 family RNA polymerase sigma factor [Rubrobacter marinus]QIN79624.1 sigma-70 family RNA polymerase sigma factor [Rubrobacter marinus]